MCRKVFFFFLRPVLHPSSIVGLTGLQHTHTHRSWHTWIKARIVKSPEELTANSVCNAKRKHWVLLPRNFKGPRWDTHLLWEIFYLDAIAAVAPQQHYHTSRKPHIWNSFGALSHFFPNFVILLESVLLVLLVRLTFIFIITFFFFF